MPLVLHEVRPARPETARWATALLAPVITAVRPRSPAPVEFRGCGLYSGFAQSRSLSPDGRVCVSGQVKFQSPDTLVLVYLHESVHRLLERYTDVFAPHSAPFYTTNLVALIGLDRAREEVRVSYGSGSGPGPTLASSMSLYDLADLPHDLADLPDRGLGRTMSWCVQVAEHCAALDVDLEEVAIEVADRYQQWILRLQAEPEKKAAEAARAAKRQAMHSSLVAGLRDQLWLRNFAIVMLSVLLLAVVTFLARLS